MFDIEFLLYTYIINIRCHELKAMLEVFLLVVQEAEAWMTMHLPLLFEVEVGEAVVEAFLLRVLRRRGIKKLLVILYCCKPWLRP